MTVDAFDRALLAIRSAGFHPDGWQNAIDRLAEATGSRLGELAGWMGPDRKPFRLITQERIDDKKMIGIWNEIGGQKPDINPMINYGRRARPLETMLDIDLIDRDARRRSLLWNEVFDPFDIPHLGSILLQRFDGTHLVLGVLRSRDQGPLTGEGLRMFERGAEEAADIASFAKSFGDEAGELVTSAMDSMNVAAIALNGFGLVVGTTARAEALISNSRCLGQSGRYLVCHDQAERKAFDDIVDRGIGEGRAGTVILRGKGEALRVSLFRLAGELDLGFNAKVILLLEDVSPEQGLTAAEMEILALLRAGLRSDAIAAQRGVSRHTVRTQVKTIYSKLGTTGQIELISRR